jgi:hypothetical protein
VGTRAHLNQRTPFGFFFSVFVDFFPREIFTEGTRRIANRRFCFTHLSVQRNAQISEEVARVLYSWDLFYNVHVSYMDLAFL